MTIVDTPGFGDQIDNEARFDMTLHLNFSLTAYASTDPRK